MTLWPGGHTLSLSESIRNLGLEFPTTQSDSHLREAVFLFISLSNRQKKSPFGDFFLTFSKFIGSCQLVFEKQ